MEHGLEMLVDGVSKRLLQRQDVLAFLTQCPRAIGLNIIDGPTIYPTDDGLAGIVLIASSHISIHTRGLEVWADVFSCQPFNVQTVVDLASELLLLEMKPRPKVQLLSRGWGKGG